MLRKRLGLSTEPQPIFVGACFTLIMLLMEIYMFQISDKGKLIALFNNPVTLYVTIINYTNQSPIDAVIWITKFIAPFLMFLCAAAYGKRHAPWLLLPSILPGLFAIGNILSGIFLSYHISYVIYAVTVIFYLVTAMGGIKSVKPFTLYCAAVCIAIPLITLFKLPPFTLYDGSIFLSDMIYFVCYHLTVLNFARAIPMQKHNR